MKQSAPFRCAFEDEDGIFIDPQPYDSFSEAFMEAHIKNEAEIRRLKGKAPDAVWFVVEISYRIVEPPGAKPRKRKVVKKTSAKSADDK